jgi:membrane associated rhomboid family serine protease
MSLRNLLKALIVMAAFLALIWILQVVNWADHYQLDQEYGILPRNVGRLGDIFSAPFLHASWAHIEGNSAPLFVLGVAAAYRGLLRFLGASVIIAIMSGLFVWFLQSGNSVTIGASGLIFGYFGYVLVRGIVDRNWIDLLVGVLAGAMYYSILQVAIPGTPGISWLGHLGGLAGGVLAAWLLRAPRRSVASKAAPAVAGGAVAGGPPRGGGTGGRPTPGGSTGGRPTPGGSTAADDLLRDLKNMGL